MDFNLYPYTVDSHTHLLEIKKKGMNITTLLQSLTNKKMHAILDIGIDESNFEKRIALKQNFSNLYFSSGIHPTSAKDIENQFKAIEKQIQNPQVIALGETGLDYHWDTVPVEKQKELFIKHIELSNKSQLPLVIHNRLADKEIIEILESENANAGGIIHCFSSNYHFARKFLDLGYYISFSGNITYKKSEEIRTAASKIPFNKILVETDAPYLSPQKLRGKINHPGNISHTIDCIADLFNKGADETAYQTYSNFKKLFKLEI